MSRNHRSGAPFPVSVKSCSSARRSSFERWSKQKRSSGSHSRIQRALLPRPDWDVDGWRARYHYQPASLVSGDCCDLIETDGGFLFLLGDVAGKGVATSMLMSHLHATFRSLAKQKLPLHILVELALTSTRLPDCSVTAEIARRQGDGTWLWVIDLFSIA